MSPAQPGLETIKLAGKQVPFEDHSALRCRALAMGVRAGKLGCLCHLAVDEGRGMEGFI